MSLYKLINTMKHFLFTIIIITFSLQVKAQAPGKQVNPNATDTSRIERAKKKYQQLFAQEIKISGNITDAETGQPLSGVSIHVEGNLIGTVTDDEGNYTLAVNKLKLPFFYFDFFGQP